ncbi:MAG: sorbosone dehydrogenase family protein [Xanthomonadales bacterium]|nr:sorbosone dehydrogenase family protein [Xanthomonadales bacterium]NIX12441.1 sorbosone dehydrogenase family protein [Xanthomonadales bacterium]
MKKFLMLVVLGSIMQTACSADLQLDLLELPPGFEIHVYADGVVNARQMALGDDDTVFVGSRREGKVYALTDSDGDQVAEQVRVIADGLERPSGLEFRDGSLYVGAINRILRYDDIENRLDSPPEPVLVTDKLPTEGHHGWKYLRFGPDGRLYIPVGAPCNICDRDGFAEIRRMNADGTGMEVYARGVRNSVGLAFHPDTGELWFTDNGRDMMGDDMPSCELNHAPRAGLHFGFPYCHQGDTPDPEFGEGRSCADYEPPALNLGPHVAPLGLAFYTGDMFPAEYRGQLFVTEHGSWNRSSKIGYRVKLVTFDEQGAVAGQEVFASGWLQDQDNWGRPNDVLQMPDGALLVSDDQAGVIYRISHTGAGG